MVEKVQPIYKATSVWLVQHNNPNEQKLPNIPKPRVPIYRKMRGITKKAYRWFRNLFYWPETTFNKDKKKGHQKLEKKMQTFF